MDDRNRAEIRADGIWDDETIEQMIADTNTSLANDPERQANREKWRQLIIKSEGRPARERERAERDREVAEYQAKQAKDKAWLAVEQEKIDKMLSEASEMLNPYRRCATRDTQREQSRDAAHCPRQTFRNMGFGFCRCGDQLFRTQR